MAEFLGFQITQQDIQAWFASARDFLLPRLAASALQLIGIAVVYWAVRLVLTRTERLVAGRTSTEIDDILIRAIRRCALLSIVFWGAWRFAAIWELPGLARTMSAAWIMAFSIPIARGLTDLMHMLERGLIARTETRVDDTALPWINRAVQFVVIGSGVMIALHQLGVDITPLLAGASVAGFAVSFAAKDTLANLIAGILLVVDRPFVIGDRIELWQAPPGQASWGDVMEVGIRATKIRTPDNIVIIIPNSVIMQRDIVNWTASGDSIRLRIPIGIAYDAPPAKAKALCLQAAAACEGVLAVPESVCIIRAFGDSSVNLELRVWIQDARQRRAIDDWLTDHIKTLFDEHGIEIPYPKRDLYIKSLPEGGRLPGLPGAAAAGGETGEST